MSTSGRLGAILAISAILFVFVAQTQRSASAESHQQPPGSDAPMATVSGTALGSRPALNEQTIWDDGLGEISYYRAKKPIYGKQREYIRVHMLNREWFSPSAGTKTENPDAPDRTPIFKLNIMHEVPTENYNYRYMTTLFSERGSLRPLKLTSSSQEWCGITYQHLVWKDNRVEIDQFNYFEHFPRGVATVASDVWPFESALLWVRQLVANPEAPPTAFMFDEIDGRFPQPLAPIPTPHYQLGDEHVIKTKMGKIATQEVTLNYGSQKHQFWVERAHPHRIVKYVGPSDEYILEHSERRAYWDRNARSKFYKPGEAP